MRRFVPLQDQDFKLGPPLSFIDVLVKVFRSSDMLESRTGLAQPETGPQSRTGRAQPETGPQSRTGRARPAETVPHRAAVAAPYRVVPLRAVPRLFQAACPRTSPARRVDHLARCRGTGPITVVGGSLAASPATQSMACGGTRSAAASPVGCDTVTRSVDPSSRTALTTAPGSIALSELS